VAIALTKEVSERVSASIFTRPNLRADAERQWMQFRFRNTQKRKSGEESSPPTNAKIELAASWVNQKLLEELHGQSEEGKLSCNWWPPVSGLINHQRDPPFSFYTRVSIRSTNELSLVLEKRLLLLPPTRQQRNRLLTFPCRHCCRCLKPFIALSLRICISESQSLTLCGPNTGR